MLHAVSGIVFLACTVLGECTAIATENSALRQQLAVLRQSVRRPRLGSPDRIFWVCVPVYGSGRDTDAIRALAVIAGKDKRARAILTEALHHETDAVREAARTALSGTQK
jgi:hypothetical protein